MDGGFRMYISDRYYRMAQMKRFLRYFLYVEIAIALTRLAYHGYDCSRLSVFLDGVLAPPRPAFNGSLISSYYYSLQTRRLLHILPTGMIMSQFNMVAPPAMIAGAFFGLWVLRRKASANELRLVGMINVVHMFLVAQLVINFLRYFVGLFATTDAERAASQARRIFVILSK